MGGLVNVNFFWGGRVIRQGGEIRYSMDPKDMRFINSGTSFEELKGIVYEVMNLSEAHWSLKMTYKYPQIGIGNVVTGYFLAKIKSDEDVNRMLAIPETMQMGLGDVSLYIDVKKNQVEEPYSFEQNIHSQQTHYSSQEDYGRGGQYPTYGTAEWTNYYYAGASNINEFGGGSSSQPVQHFEEGRNFHTVPSPTRPTVTGRDLAFIHENNENEFGGSSSEDIEDLSDDSEDSSEEEDEEVPETRIVCKEQHVPRASWFQEEDYTSVVLHNQVGQNFNFNEGSEELVVGQMFMDKQKLMDAVRQVHIATDRMYIVVRSNPEQYIVKCVVSSCPGRLRAAKKKNHGFWEITKCNEHNCTVAGASQQHKKISARFICKLVKPYVSSSSYYKKACNF